MNNLLPIDNLLLKAIEEGKYYRALKTLGDAVFPSASYYYKDILSLKAALTYYKGRIKEGVYCEKNQLEIERFFAQRIIDVDQGFRNEQENKKEHSLESIELRLAEIKESLTSNSEKVHQQLTAFFLSVHSVYQEKCLSVIDTDIAQLEEHLLNQKLYDLFQRLEQVHFEKKVTYGESYINLTKRYPVLKELHSLVIDNQMDESVSLLQESIMKQSVKYSETSVYYQQMLVDFSSILSDKLKLQKGYLNGLYTVIQNFEQIIRFYWNIFSFIEKHTSIFELK